MYSRNYFLISIILLLLTVGCIRNSTTEHRDGFTDNKVIIKGLLEGGGGQSVILEEMGAREFIPLDTVQCNDSGSFEISFSPDQVAFYVLRYGPSGYVTLLLEPGDNLEFVSPFEHKESYRVIGSRGSEILQKLSLEHKNVLNVLGTITRKNMELVSSPEYSTRKLEFDRQFDSVTTRFREYSLQFIHENAGSLAILVALYNHYGQGLPVFHPDRDLEVYHFVDSALMSRYSGIEAVELLNAQVNEAKPLLNEDRLVGQPEKGEIAPDFVSSRTDGSQLALSDLRGDYVLLAFWAAWSNLSRDENPTLKRAKEIYGKYPFRILQVSFDDNRKVWESAIEEDGLDWDHVSELKRWETPVADLYQMEKIPSNMLIDPSGRIVETDLFGDNLLEKLEIIFSE